VQGVAPQLESAHILSDTQHGRRQVLRVTATAQQDDKYVLSDRLKDRRMVHASNGLTAERYFAEYFRLGVENLDRLHQFIRRSNIAELAASQNQDATVGQEGGGVSNARGNGLGQYRSESIGSRSQRPAVECATGCRPGRSTDQDDGVIFQPGHRVTTCSE